jgi:hypothetical protein
MDEAGGHYIKQNKPDTESHLSIADFLPYVENRKDDLKVKEGLQRGSEKGIERGGKEKVEEEWMDMINES